MKKLTDRKGIIAVDSIVTNQFGWIFREMPICDYGIDAQIEIFDDKYPSGKLIAAQIKTGESYLKYDAKKDIVFYGENKHLKYWLGYSIPVILIIHDDVSGTSYWQAVKEEFIVETESAWKITIPKQNIFEVNSKEAVRKLLEPPAWKNRLSGLAMHIPYMQAIIEGDRFIVEVEEWINKSSGRGAFKFIVIDSNGSESEVDKWPWIMAPGWNYPELFEHIFPWAEISIDEDFYYDYEKDAWNEDCGIKDHETGRYMSHSETFREWRSSLPIIRPYKNEAGEVDCYRIELHLSSLGKAFLEVNKYIQFNE